MSLKVETETRAEAAHAERSPVEPVLGNYFVSAYPPFACWTPGHLPGFRHHLAQAHRGARLGLYVHVPFCVHRCDYCYYMCRDDSFSDAERYLSALIAEMEGYASTAAVGGRTIDFVYFGGGTPSTLTAAQTRRLFGRLQQAAPWTDAREITFECAPKTVTPEKLEALRDGGVTRLSLGAQQLDDRVLALNGRIHRTADFVRAWREARRFEFEVMNLDLIAGLVGESDDSFFRSLERALEMDPDSVTIYLLEIPLNTSLARALRGSGPSPELPSWDEKRDRLERAFGRLEEAGFSVRSAYTAVRDPARHAFVYQDAQYRGSDLLGIGASAFSYLGGWHQQNDADLTAYLERVEAGRLPLARAYPLNHEERLVREFVLQLKLGGVDLDRLREQFGEGADELLSRPLRKFERLGWLIRTPSAVRMTRKGLLRVDRLLESFYLPEHRDPANG